ncbi:MAG: sigma-70 family RNA polymerase sigma factor [Saprospiraceae bacterium]|jgi:RNA polymerase sigma-70 factor (ECF subfamily)|nr:sigma-70 family RNA polymerase sigma factor [Saprospiraceae bacterium]MBK6480489.1 sigma-70 family RNA polymerase sigma factor [Saprospiraceae bacterium]MBK6817140.1 sigma-70 family RNA polymerase sigma factor [Saprospiraceae bacterium]MBK7371690.1 sigma-70 family RNA polymerase sigma factor [Saprospiraceae bacterium]MBK7435833.1 sigma-70 family RNA polymerase sigma factor [Saprospiraceae bacterium]
MSTFSWGDRPDEKALVESCLSGLRSAQAALYDRYSKAMYNICLRMMTMPEEAEDLLQESFVDVFSHLHSYRYESTLGAWIKRIVVNRCINKLKSRRMHLIELTSQEPDPEPDPSFDFDDQDLRVVKIKKAMTALPDGYRTVLTLYLFEGYDHKEIGEILNISEETSKSQYSRAKVKLKELMS